MTKHNPYLSMTDGEKLSYIAAQELRLSKLDEPFSPHLDFFRSQIGVLIMKELASNIFVEGFFNKRIIGDYSRKVWFEFILNNYLLSGSLKEVFDSALNLRRELFENMEEFVSRNPNFPREFIASTWIRLDGLWTTKEKLILLDSLVKYPNLWTDKLIFEVLFYAALRSHSQVVFPATDCAFYVSGFNNLIGIRNSMGSDVSLLMTLDSKSSAFISKDPILFKKFKNLSIGGPEIVYAKLINPIIQVGVYLAALEDGLGDLSIDTLCSVYGVTPNLLANYF